MPATLSQFKCNGCGQTFSNKGEFDKHSHSNLESGIRKTSNTRGVLSVSVAPRREGVRPSTIPSSDNIFRQRVNHTINMLIPKIKPSSDSMLPTISLTFPLGKSILTSTEKSNEFNLILGVTSKIELKKNDDGSHSIIIFD